MTAARDDLTASQADSHCCSATASATSARHPLDPLDGAELARAASILNEAFGKTEPIRFERIEVAEPEKAFLRSWKQGDAFERQARFAIFRRGLLGVTEGVLSLDKGRVISSRDLPTARPMIMLEEFLEVETAVKADPRFVAACKRRGIDDVSMVCVDPWSAGSFDIPGEEGRRISHTFSWLRTQPHSAYYAHPIEGVNAVVDVDTMEVLRVDDHYEGREPLAVPMTRNEYACSAASSRAATGCPTARPTPTRPTPSMRRRPTRACSRCGAPSWAG